MSLDERCKISFSVVSHGHGSLVLRLLESLIQQFENHLNFIEIVITFNIPEPYLDAALKGKRWSVRLKFICNTSPKGFGANHNYAFHCSSGLWFVVLNPDIVWMAGGSSDSFLQGCSNHSHNSIGLLAPSQFDTKRRRQDSMRKLITPRSLAARLVSKWRYPERLTEAVESIKDADWVNGACMFVRSDVYRLLGGFDERYFMYCEDADLCLRLQLAGYTMAQADFSVIHDARRDTTRKLSHLVWHVTSLLRFWSSSAFWKFLIHKRLLSQKRSGA